MTQRLAITARLAAAALVASGACAAAQAQARQAGPGGRMAVSLEHHGLPDGARAAGLPSLHFTLTAAGDRQKMPGSSASPILDNLSLLTLPAWHASSKLADPHALPGHAETNPNAVGLSRNDPAPDSNQTHPASGAPHPF